MKIRNGFISNSSSSSYIITPNNELNTVKDVAKYIINTLLSDNDNIDYFNELLSNLENISEPDTPLNFNTGGDQNYIRKEQDKIIIVTTQNVEFPEIEKVALSKKDLNISFYKYFDHINEYGEKVKPRAPYEFDYFYSKFKDFLILDHAEDYLYGRITWIDNCPHCKNSISRGWILKNGQTYCNCQTDKVLNIARRRRKLLQIQNGKI